MPVLDANALKTDPKGAAFLLSVLRQSCPKQTPFGKPAELNQTQTRIAKLRDWRLHSVTAL